MTGHKRSTPPADDSEDAATRPAKRNRQVLSCLPCRERKVACDRQHPCFSCVRYREPQKCTYSSGNGTSSVVTNNSVPHSTALPANAVHNDKSSLSATSAASSPSPVANPFARGRLLAKADKTMFYIGPSAWSVTAPVNVFNDAKVYSSIHPHWLRLLALSIHYPPKPYDTIVDLDPQTNDPAPLDSYLPSNDECLASVKAFLDSVNIVYPVVERSDFEHAVRSFLADRKSATGPWLGLLLAIIAAGDAVRAFTEGHLSSLLPRSDQISAIVHTKALSYSIASYRSTLPVFQTILVLILLKTLRFTWMDGNAGAQGLLGMASRLSLTMGLHRDPGMSLDDMPPKEAALRRQVFATYVLLDYTHSLQCGMPLLLRASDFDVDYTDDKTHLGIFMRLFPLLSQAEHITHSLNSTSSHSETLDILSKLQATAGAMSTSFGAAADMPTALATCLPMVLISRAQMGLYISVLDVAPTRATFKLTNDLLTPGLNIMDMFTTLISQFSSPVLLICLLRHTVLAAVGYSLTFLHRSLGDDTLLAARGNLPAALDSTRLLRLVRATMADMRPAVPFGLQCVREWATENLYLRYVEERHRQFIATGLAVFDPSSKEGQEVLKAMQDSINESLQTIEGMMGPVPAEQGDPTATGAWNWDWDWEWPAAGDGMVWGWSNENMT